jgi:hypothetical protein
MNLLTLILVILVALVAAKWYNEKYMNKELPQTSVLGGSSNYLGSNFINNSSSTMSTLGGSGRMSTLPQRTGGRLNVVPIN